MLEQDLSFLSSMVAGDAQVCTAGSGATIGGVVGCAAGIGAVSELEATELADEAVDVALTASSFSLRAGAHADDAGLGSC